LILSAGLLLIANLVNLTSRYLAIGILEILALLLTFWSLKEGLEGIEWLTVPILPVFYTLGAALFYFLLPSGILSLLTVALGFAFGMYVLLLTENIFSVAAMRTIALFRAASSVAFLLTLITAFLLFDAIFSFRSSFWVNALFVFLVSWFLSLQGLWAVKLEKKLETQVLFYSFVLAFVLGQLAAIISFWPVGVSLVSLFLTTVDYVLLGLSQAKLADRFFRKTVREYLIVGVGVFITLLLTTRWGG